MWPPCDRPDESSRRTRPDDGATSPANGCHRRSATAACVTACGASPPRSRPRRRCARPNDCPVRAPRTDRLVGGRPDLPARGREAARGNAAQQPSSWTTRRRPALDLAADNRGITALVAGRDRRDREPTAGTLWHSPSRRGRDTTTARATPRCSLTAGATVCLVTGPTSAAAGSSLMVNTERRVVHERPSSRHRRLAVDDAHPGRGDLLAHVGVKDRRSRAFRVATQADRLRRLAPSAHRPQPRPPVQPRR